MGTIRNHTESSIKKHKIKSNKTKHDIYLVHEFIDRIKYIGPNLELRAITHNSWFVKEILPIYLDTCPLFLEKKNKELYMQIGTEHLLEDFKGNMLTIEDIYLTSRIPPIKKTSYLLCRKTITEPVGKTILDAIYNSKIGHLLVSHNGFLSSYILHGIITNVTEKSVTAYRFIKHIKKILVDNNNIDIDGLRKYMKHKVPYLNNGFDYINPDKNETAE